MKTIIVTGGAGYIGQHACKKLIAAGYNVVVIDRDPVHVKYADHCYVKDLCNREAITSILDQHKHDAVAIMHFAASAYVGESVVNPALYYQNNISNSEILFTAAKNAGIKNVIFSSSCATYGIHDDLITEETAQVPMNPYGFTKYAIERLLADYEVAYGMKHIALRYFNAAGSSPDLEIGENHNPETHVIPLMLHAAKGITDDFTIYGEDYNTPDGTCIRSYVHVDDIADAHLFALEYLLTHNKSDCFNLATPYAVSVKEIVNAVTRVTGKDFKVLYGDRRIGDPDILTASPAKAARLLQWQPQYSLDDMILHAWNYLNKED